ncbi:MAG: hypothetical protein KBA61_05755 [Spirochaetes bacterium]|nr:hypothetical protein [Spirochaetota bacterium]
MILNIVTLVSCVFLMFLFRRLDRSNLRMIKLKRFADKASADFRKIAEKEQRRYGDATIEMDILIKRGTALSAGMKDSIQEIENRLKGLHVEKANLGKVEDDLKVISAAARDVNRQIEFIAASRSDFDDFSKKVTYLTENLTRVERESASLVGAFSDKVRERSKELSEEIAVQVNRIKESIREKEDRLLETTGSKIDQLTQRFADTLSEMERGVAETGDAVLDTMRLKVESLNKVAGSVEGRIETVDKRITGITGQVGTLNETLADMENTVFAEIKAKSEEMKSAIAASVQEFATVKDSFLEKMDTDIAKVHSKLKSVEDNIDQSKSKLIHSFEEEVNKVRTEIDNLSIHAISKKDDIVKATRREAEEVMAKIDEFGEKYQSMQEKLTHMEAQLASSMESRMEKTKMEFTSMEERLADIRNEIVRYEESQNIFARTDEMVRKVETSVQDYSEIMRQAKEESRAMEQFMEDVQKFKEIRRAVEKEIKVFESRREKVRGFEGEIQALLGLTDTVFGKVDTLEDKIARVDQVNARIDALAEGYRDLDARIHELHEYEDSIVKNLESVTRTELAINSIDSRVKAFQKSMERSEKKNEKMLAYLQSVEEKTLMLKTREQEITEVKDKFGELEGLSEHIERKIDQIHAMFTKLESMRKEVDTTDTRLRDMFDQTDRKMKQLADFLKAVDTNSPISKQVKGDIPMGKNLSEGTIKVVRELSGKGWTSGEISKKLLLDENSVRFIINTTSL